MRHEWASGVLGQVGGHMPRRRRGVEYVPAEPFSRWLQQRYEWHQRRLGGDPQAVRNNHADAGAAVCREINWPDAAGLRRLYRYRYQLRETARGKTPEGKKRLHVEPATVWRRSVVEDALHHAGVPFAWLYPEIVAAEEVPLEPDMTCWTCWDVVTPVNGECLWCGTQLRYADERELAA